MRAADHGSAQSTENRPSTAADLSRPERGTNLPLAWVQPAAHPSSAQALRVSSCRELGANVTYGGRTSQENRPKVDSMSRRVLTYEEKAHRGHSARAYECTARSGA